MMHLVRRRFSAALVPALLAASAASAFGQINMDQANRKQKSATAPSGAIRVLVTTVNSPDPKLGLELASELREKVQNQYAPKELWVIPKEPVDTLLMNSGFSPDSAPALNDAMEIGRALGGTETLMGRLTKGGAGVIFAPRFYLDNNKDFVELFAPVEGKNVGAVADLFAKQYKEMRKILPDTRKCKSALIGQRYDEAANLGRAVIKGFAPSNLGRLCLLSAFLYQKAPADSVIRVATEIYEKDTMSVLALDNLQASYLAKGDKENFIRFAMKFLAAAPNNTGAAMGIINSLFQVGSPEAALPIIDKLKQTNPNDPDLLKKELSLQLTLKSYKKAYPIADELLQADTSVGTLDFYQRMIGAAQLDSNQTQALAYFDRALKKFPKEAGMHLAYSGELRKANQNDKSIDEAKKAVEIQPKIPGGVATVIGMYVRQNMADSAFAFARRALAAGVEADTVGALLIGTVKGTYDKASSSNARADWEAVLKAAYQVDSLVPTSASKFFIGMSAASIGFNALTASNEAYSAKPPNTVLACSEADVAEKMLALATTAITTQGGGKYSAEGAAAVMKNVFQYNTVPGQIKAAAKCK